MSSSPYAPAAQMLTTIWTQHKSIKTIAYDSKTGSLKCSKATYAQVCHVLDSQSVLRQVLKRMGSSFDNVRNEGLLYVLAYELLLGPNRRIRGGGALKRKLTAKEACLRRVLAEIQGNKKTQRAVSSVAFPRYVRINAFRPDSDEVIGILRGQSRELFADIHVPDVLVLPPGTTLHDNDLVKQGRVVLQDKSSCFSALCLVHGNDSPLEGDILDACAAPGNKTSHLASLLLNRNSPQKLTVFALDRASERLALLTRRLDQLGISHNHRLVRVSPMHADFLKTVPSEFDAVRGILLDPSCSGSGIFTSPDRHADLQDDENGVASSSRLQSLSNFQLTTLRHAMSFPNVQRIVYSTCSLHEIENECVVSQAIAMFSDEWRIVSPSCLLHWKRRGQVVDGLTPEQAACLIRADRDDETNGFFVSYFERYDASTDASAAPRNMADDEPAWGPPEGVSFYNGEFSVSTSTKNRASPGTDESPSNPVANPAIAKAAGEGRPTELRKAAQPQAKTEKEKALGKKRKKKQAWKQRQREQKRVRLEAKHSHGKPS